MQNLVAGRLIIHQSADQDFAVKAMFLLPHAVDKSDRIGVCKVELKPRIVLEFADTNRKDIEVRLEIVDRGIAEHAYSASVRGGFLILLPSDSSNAQPDSASNRLKGEPNCEHDYCE